MEAKEALIKVVGRQWYDGDEDERIELTTIGTLEEEADAYVLHYREDFTEQTPVETCLTVMKDASRVELLRSGGVDALLMIESGKRNPCAYTTEYGELMLGITGKCVELVLEEKRGRIVFGYEIDTSGSLVSRNEVTVNFRTK